LLSGTTGNECAGQRFNYTGNPVQARGWWKVGVACIKGEEASV
jgi:hypothetical protein